MSRTDEATTWAARLDAGPLTEADQLQLSEWLAADPLNKGALVRAQAMLCLIYTAPEREAEAASVPPAAVEETPGDASPSRNLRRRWLMAGVSVAAAAAAAIVVIVPTAPLDAQYSTQTGEVRRVALDDGSRAVINTGSKVETSIGNRERLVTLEHGEAWFSVVTDRRRPFTVQAGPVRVMAVGTAFAVRREASSVTVTVTEGAVKVWNEAQPQIQYSAKAGESTTLPFDPRLAARPQIRPARESALAWRDGDIVLEGMTLAAAVEEFNRYNIRKIKIASPEIAGMSMVGYFRVNQPEQFATSVAELAGATVVHDGNTIVIKP